MSVAAKICRRMSPKTFALTAIGLTIILCVYYANYTTDIRTNQTQDNAKGNEDSGELPQPQRIFELLQRSKISTHKEFQMCPKLYPAEADVNTLDVFKDFEFQVSKKGWKFLLSFTFVFVRNALFFFEFIVEISHSHVCLSCAELRNTLFEFTKHGNNKNKERWRLLLTF